MFLTRNLTRNPLETQRLDASGFGVRVHVRVRAFWCARCVRVHVRVHVRAMVWLVLMWALAP